MALVNSIQEKTYRATGNADTMSSPQYFRNVVLPDAMAKVTPDWAKEYGFGAQSPYRFYYQQIGTKLVRAGRANLFKDNKEQPDSDITTDSITNRLVMAGPVNQIVDEMLKFRETIGDFGTLLYCGMDWVDPKLARRSMELMAERVMPAVACSFILAILTKTSQSL